MKLREWNEALDLEVYALAALYIMGPATLHALGDLAARAARSPEEKPVPAAANPIAGIPRALLRPRGRWIRGFRR